MLAAALGRDSAPGRALLEAFERSDLSAIADSPATNGTARNGHAADGAATNDAPYSTSIQTFELLLSLIELRLEGEVGAEQLARMAEDASELSEGLSLELRRARALAAATVRGLRLPAFDLDAPTDLLGDLFQDLALPPHRRRLGEHYTPAWVAERLLEPLEWTGAPGTRLLDPACGSGIFLLHALARCRKSRPDDGPAAWLERLAGIDIQPHAVRAARLNLRLALQDVAANPAVDHGRVEHCSTDRCRVEHCSVEHCSVDHCRVDRCRVDHCVQIGDALTLEPGTPPLDRPITHLVGNPPWVGWENLPERHRGSALHLWEREGLFDQRGWRARMGAAKKDLSMLFVALAGSSWLAPQGRLGLVLPRSLATSAASSGLRRRVSEGLLVVERLEDLSRIRVFAGTAAPMILLIGRRPEDLKGSAPRLEPAPGSETPPISWIEWRPRARQASLGTLRQMLQATTRQELTLGLEPGSGAAWVPTDPAASSVPTPEGLSGYRAYEGANTGGANGIFWLELLEPANLGRDVRASLVRVRNLPERGRRPLPLIEAEIEAAFVWPLLRGREVSPWLARPSGHLLLVQDPATRRGYPVAQLELEGPRTLEMLRHFELELAGRPLFRKFFRPHRDAWYSIYNVGPYTVTPWKVVWRELGSRLTSAVVGPDGLGRGVVPDHKLMLVACQTPAEAHFLCAVLNSPPAAAVAERLCLSTSVATHVLQHLAIPRFDPTDAHHRALSALSVAAHVARARGKEIEGGLEARLTREVHRLWTAARAAGDA